MKKSLITAIGIEKLNKRISEELDCDLLCKDILYEEGIFEYLEKNSKINFIIINLDFLIINNIKNFIEKIKKINKNINIIFLTNNKNEKNENFENVKYININNYVFKNIEKEIVSNTENKIFEEKEEYSYESVKESVKEINNKKVISIAGCSGVGKSIFTATFAKTLNKKILIIDFDFFNHSIHTLFGVKKIEKEIVKINKYEINISNIIEIIEKIKNEYDYIIIDTSSEVFFDCTKEILKYSDCILFLIEANLLELKKSINLLNLYKENWKIENSKIKIIINKINKNSINKKINEKIFLENEIIGEIKYSEIYNFLINKNMKILKENLFLKNKYKKILNKITLENKKN